MDNNGNVIENDNDDDDNVAVTHRKRTYMVNAECVLMVWCVQFNVE